MLVIEMNPRVSRSSALASKATGFPIAKIAAKLAVGYTLDELKNDITGGATPASFEPTIDYVVTKVPRFTFEKFPQADDRLTTQMKSVGEVMAIGRTFQESLQKALRGLETGVDGFDADRRAAARRRRRLQARATSCAMPGAGPHLVRRRRVPRRADARGGAPSSRASIRGSSRRSRSSSTSRSEVATSGARGARRDALRALKRMGFSDRRLATLHRRRRRTTSASARHALGVRPVYKRVDTCAAEFATHDGVPLLDLRGGVRGGADRPRARS